MTQASLLDWTPPLAAPRAPEGVKLAAKAASGSDLAILRWFAANPGRVATKAELAREVSADLGRDLDPDTTRRRRDELQRQGLLAFETLPGGKSQFRVLAVREGEGAP